MQKIIAGVVGFNDDFTPGDCERCRFSYYNDDYTSVYCVFDCNCCPLCEFDLPMVPDEKLFFICPDGDESSKYLEDLMARDGKEE